MLAIATAVGIFGLLKKRYSLLVTIVIFLALWLLLRFYSFSGITGGNYIFNGASVFSRLVRFGVLEFIPIGVDPALNLTYPIFALNIVLWGVLIYFALEAKRRVANKSYRLGEINPTLALICLAFSSYYFVLIQGVPRFTYSIYMQFLVCVVIFIRPNLTRFLIIALILSVTIFSSYSSFLILKNQRPVIDYQFSASKNLVSMLKENEPSSRNIYVVNDFISAYSSEQNVAKYSGFNEPQKILRANSIAVTNCNLDELQTIDTNYSIDISDSSSIIIIEIEIPQCANFVFEGADRKKLNAFVEGDILKRNAEIFYRIPNLNLDKIGKKMVIVISNAKAIYFDFKKSRWIAIGAQ